MAYRSYRELRAWQEAFALAVDVMRLANQFPKHELYGLADQLRRAAVSAPSNLAEGQARGGDDFCRYIRISLGSMQELQTQLLIAKELAYADGSALDRLVDHCESTQRTARALLSAVSPANRKPQTAN